MLRLAAPRLFWLNFKLASLIVGTHIGERRGDLQRVWI